LALRKSGFGGSVKIGDHIIGTGYAHVVAELGLNHGGDIGRAIEMVYAARDAGANSIKAQAFSPRCFLSKNAEYKGKPQLELFESNALSDNDIAKLAARCNDIGMPFFATPDCLYHALMLVDLGVQVIKIGSDDLDYIPFLEEIAKIGLPVILSSGMSTDAERRIAINLFSKARVELAMLVCTSLYPTPIESAQLYRIQEYRHMAIIGYSDHTDDTDTAAAAVLLGAKIVEKHFTLDRTLPGPDNAFSADPKRFSEMVDKIRKAELIKGNDGLEPADLEMRSVARRSIVAKTDLAQGAIIKPRDLAYRRSGPVALSPGEYVKVVGSRLLRDIKADEQIRIEDFERL
jgi:N,N'-diacetyllegionaminate synthase